MFKYLYRVLPVNLGLNFHQTPKGLKNNIKLQKRLIKTPKGFAKVSTEAKHNFDILA